MTPGAFVRLRALLQRFYLHALIGVLIAMGNLLVISTSRTLLGAFLTTAEVVARALRRASQLGP